MNNIIFCDTSGKDEILEILDAFNKDKTKNLQQKKYQCANQLRTCRKSDLETVKADIEYSIDNGRSFAAFLAVFGLLVSKQIAQWLTINSMLNGESLVVSFFSILSAWLFIHIGNKVSLLHVIKIALARKSDT